MYYCIYDIINWFIDENSSIIRVSYEDIQEMSFDEFGGGFTLLSSW